MEAGNNHKSYSVIQNTLQRLRICLELVWRFASVKRGMESVNRGMESVMIRIESVKGGIESVKGGMESVKRGMESVKGRIESVMGGIESVKRGMGFYLIWISSGNVIKVGRNFKIK